MVNPDIDAACDTVGARLARIAQRFPDNIAVVERDKELNYRQFDAAASAIARQIGAAGQDRPGRICLFFQNKLPAITRYFRLRPMRSRIRSAGRRGSAGAIALHRRGLRAFPLSDRKQPDRKSPRGRAAGLRDRRHRAIQAGEDTRPPPQVAADAPLFLYYTSGSTGQPKGVIQTHRNLLFYADAYAKGLGITASDRLSLAYTLSFNAANMDIYSSLLNGAALCAYDMRGDGIPKFADWLDLERITVLHTVPTVFRELGNRLAPGRVLPHIRVIDLGGESVFASDIDLFRGHFLETCVLDQPARLDRDRPHRAAQDRARRPGVRDLHRSGRAAVSPMCAWRSAAMTAAARCPMKSAK